MAMERPPDCEAFKAQVISDQEAGTRVCARFGGLLTADSGSCH
jgi:hypothetical protein